MTDSTTDQPTTRGRQGSGNRSRGRAVWLFVRDIIVIFIVALLVSFLIKTFLIRSFYIPSASMEDTLMINDRIIVNELEPKLMPVHRGDIVVFTDPGGWLTGGENIQAPEPSNPVARGLSNFFTFIGLGTADSDNHLVKRVIGVPGDHVVCCNTLNQITVNGTPIKEPYTTVQPGDQAAGSPFDVTVPPGDLWVLGDNRHDSADSSAHQSLPSKGFVPEKDVVGRAFVISWPISRWSWLSNYPDVFRGIGQSGK
ncbi:signal peptidase I [Gryllotalpicola protaetiae]|uniref:Signal peptidase I n=1 Tax=Gryllotalpicola protaetiae TaxID=2419771 RepID=A0A387BIT6_9MICO|nr:signal peptidase I [Gryllotalpicola protaetiae]AYG02132.1 signal peptidase I [Gryllotalpicola protaetiae]